MVFPGNVEVTKSDGIWSAEEDWELVNEEE